MGGRGSGEKVTTMGDGLGALHASRTAGVGLRAGGRTVNIVYNAPRYRSPAVTETTTCTAFRLGFFRAAAVQKQTLLRSTKAIGRHAPDNRK